MLFGEPFTIIFLVNRLSQFEKLVEQLVETPFVRLFKPRLHPADLAKALARAMEQGAVAADDGRILVPHRYTVRLHPADVAILRRQSDLAEEIAAIERYLSLLVSETASATIAPPRVKIVEDESVAVGQMAISADHQLSPEADGNDTKQFQPTLPPANRWQLRLPNGTVSLGMPIVRIGRDAANDVVLTHPTVSRHHAQLRWKNNVYFVENLSRRQPLGLNFTAVEKPTPLKAGDSLQLGQVTIRVEIIP